MDLNVVAVYGTYFGPCDVVLYLCMAFSCLKFGFRDSPFSFFPI